jgi:hypothetical protein
MPPSVAALRPDISPESGGLKRFEQARRRRERQADDEATAQPFARFDVEPSLHRADQLARLEGADPEPTRLVETKGLNRRLRTKSGLIPDPASITSMAPWSPRHQP